MRGRDDSATIYGDAALLRKFNPELPQQAASHVTQLAGGPNHPVKGGDVRRAISDFGETHQTLISQGRGNLAKVADSCFSGLVCVYINATGDVDVYRDLPKGQPVTEILEARAS